MTISISVTGESAVKLAAELRLVADHLDGGLKDMVGVSNIKQILKSAKSVTASALDDDDFGSSEDSETAEADEGFDVDSDEVEEKPAPKKKTAPAPAKKSATPIAKSYTIDEVRAACMKYAAKHSRVDTDAILQKVGGAKKINLIDASKYGALMKALK